LHKKCGSLCGAAQQQSNKLIVNAQKRNHTTLVFWIGKQKVTTLLRFVAKKQSLKRFLLLQCCQKLAKKEKEVF
jgi:hypothetical protein